MLWFSERTFGLYWFIFEKVVVPTFVLIQENSLMGRFRFVFDDVTTYVTLNRFTKRALFV
ncbi:hypothetical protein LEP1GSC052_3197 [Leptospira kmetyi serovar Malaysia str. Bejo-Iso9]|nr:hypothetical protein LEP1GSC052_3197 [Leptospira kmetyi serovar Malaysia str. Bejo-Iso9]